MSDAWRDTEGDSQAPASSVPPRQAGIRLLRQLLLYHLALAAMLALLMVIVPRLPDYLPVGGLTELMTGADARMERPDAPAAVVPANPRTQVRSLDRFGYARQLVITLACTWLLMLPVSWLHRGIYRGQSYDHSMSETTLILPGVVAAIVFVVQYSLALAFALAGIVAGVQFRRALQDTFDALFILTAIGTGIAAGVGALEVAAVMTIFFCYATIHVCWLGESLESDHQAGRKERKRRRKGNDEEV